MNGRVKYIFILALVFGMRKSCFAQSKKIDSLKPLLISSKPDTNKVNLLNELSFSLYSTDPDSTIILAEQALTLAKQINFKRGEANAYGNKGVGYRAKGNYPLALANYSNALSIDEATHNKAGIAKRLASIGLVYKSRADYPKALDYYFKALKMEEELGNKSRVAISLGNIGIVYYLRGDLPKALSYYEKALKIDEELERKSGILSNLGNIGIVYMDQVALHGKGIIRDNFISKAFSYYSRALKIAEDLKDKRSIAINLVNTGAALEGQKNYLKALDHYSRALKINEEYGSKNGIADCSRCIGSLYFKMMNSANGSQKGILEKNAEKYLAKSLDIYYEIGGLDGIKHLELAFSDLDSARGNYKESMEHYKRYVATSDQINNEENTKKQTQYEMQYEFDKKEASTKAEQEKKDVIARAELRQKEQQRNYFIIGFFLVILLTLFILRGYRQKQMANKVISYQKEEVEKQKAAVEEHQKEILDSIHYAKRIQQSLLPTEKYIERVLGVTNKNK